MAKTARARLLEIDSRIHLLNILISQDAEEDHVTKESPRHILNTCVADCPACAALQGFFAEQRELNIEQRELLLEIARDRLNINPQPANEVKKQAVQGRRAWLQTEVERRQKKGDDVEASRKDRSALRRAFQEQFKTKKGKPLSDSTFRTDLKALGYKLR